ncbi:required for drug-induced death protein 1-like [Gadus chalcogrammus]|uniref:required for drug-induced death protein 1-like n=1 Tax=Gadus chalcogrammus TaxID=1042646 RepID=UPI0024C3C238|nr:required for drug-induced death protein 1-like [Gadus chalcogrammus]
MARTKNRETTCSGAGSTPGEAASLPGDGAAAAGREAPSAGSRTGAYSPSPGSAAGEEAPSDGSEAGPRKANKSSKEVYFAVLPDKYQPLLEEEEEESEEQRWRRKEEKRRKKREKHKRCRKSLGRALRWTWRSLVAGLQSLAAVYSAPFTAPTTLAAACSKA